MSYLLEGESPIIKPSGNSKGVPSISFELFENRIFVRGPSHFHFKFSVQKPNCSNSETFENRGLTVFRHFRVKKVSTVVVLLTSMLISNQMWWPCNPSTGLIYLIHDLLCETPSWGPSKESLSLLYKAFLRPLLTYDSPEWFPFLGVTNITKLERLHRAASRAITGCLSSTPIPLLLYEASLTPLRVTLTHFTLSSYERALRVPISFPI